MEQERRAIAVFGSSEPRFGEPAYETARAAGRLIAEAGFTVVCGGYGGVMEAASRGARESGGPAIGVTCETFRDRAPNRFLTRVVSATDLFDRTRTLIDLSAGFLVLPGKAGTLAELAFLWALHRAGCLEGRPVVLLGVGWEAFLELLGRNAMLDPTQLSITRTSDTAQSAVRELTRLLETRRHDP